MRRKRLMGTLTLLLAVCQGNATALADTVVVVDKPTRVEFTDKGNQVKLDVQGSEDNPAYRFTYTKSFRSDNPETLVIRERSDWGFNLPFSKYTKKHRRSRGFDGHWEGLGFGFCNAADAGTGGLGAGRSVNTTMGNSFEIFWNIFSVDYAPWKNGWGLVSGVGIDWRNYRMTGHTRFVKEDGNLHLDDYPEGADIKFSRIKTFSVTVPFLLEWQSPRGRNSYFFSAGAIVCLNTYGSVKTRYKLDGKKYKEFNKNIHENPLTVDLTAMAGVRNLGAYFKYSPCRVLQTDYAPAFNAMSVGVMWLF